MGAASAREMVSDTAYSTARFVKWNVCQLCVNREGGHAAGLSAATGGTLIRTPRGVAQPGRAPALGAGGFASSNLAAPTFRNSIRSQIVGFL